MKTPKIMRIEWDDACHTSRQFYGNELPDDSVRLVTVGHVVKENKKSICLAVEISEDDGFRHVHSIPKSLIRKKRVLK